MYRIGDKKRNTKHHVKVMVLFVLLSVSISAGLYMYLNHYASTSSIKQASPSTQLFKPGSTNNPLRIDNDIYSMQLPSDWKQISVNKDSRYSSLEWQLESGGKNRWLILYTDRVPADIAVNKVIPVATSGNDIVPDTVSDNCSGFTRKISDANLKTPSKWQGANFLCDLSNATDNVVGVSDKITGTTLTLSGPVKGKHSYVFIYTDRGIPEDQIPITMALESFAPK